ncbi:MAG: hypothetical protein QOG71_3451 [Pyrinomonadaceae bacterium]|nr:hypothetical protein [Pyrinomonadaceae bacterium]
MPEHDIPGLGKKITALSKALANLNSEDDFKELIRIIRFPGWTTPAEFILVSALVDSMTAQAATLARMKTDLLKGSRKVAVGK